MLELLTCQMLIWNQMVGVALAAANGAREVSVNDVEAHLVDQKFR